VLSETRTVTIKAKSNSDRTNAMVANNAHKVKPWTDQPTVVLPQDQFAHVLKNLTQAPTHVFNAHSVNSQVMEELNKTLDAEQPIRTVMLLGKFN